MNEIISNLLEDKKGGITFNCFGIYHIIYMVLILSVLVGLILLLRKKDESYKLKAINITILVAFIMYILDFFLMPFAITLTIYTAVIIVYFINHLIKKITK